MSAIGVRQVSGMLPVDRKECRQLHREGDEPGYGIGSVQTLGRVILRDLENGADPANADPAHAQNGDDHGYPRCAHASQSAGGYIHETAEKIGQQHPPQAQHSVGNGFGRVGNYR